MQWFDMYWRIFCIAFAEALTKELARLSKLSYWVRLLSFWVLSIGMVRLLGFEFTWPMMWLVLFINCLGATRLFPPQD